MPAARPDLPLALTIGDPAGIGPELAVRIWLARQEDGCPPFYLICDPGQLAARAKALGLQVRIAETEPGEALAAFATVLPVLPLRNRLAETPGRPDTANNPGILESIERAVADCLSGLAGAIVTNPIAKKSLYESGFAFPGHTEYLAHLAATRTGRPHRPVMMLAAPGLRTIPVTIHEPLAKVPALLTSGLIVETARIAAGDLAGRFGISRPRLAIAGLNPHAGEGGTMGGEDEAVVRPAIAVLKAEGIDAFGPLPADTMFHPEARRGYDAAVCMYHDQALIPVKTLAFDEAVNVTLGLPFVRTSPDHGTAFDIAGAGTARPHSLLAALRLAAQLASNTPRHA